MSLIVACMAMVAVRSVREPIEPRADRAVSRSSRQPIEPRAVLQLSKLAKRLQGDRQPVSEAPGSRPQRLTVFSHLKDQGCRAMDSVALNIAEGIARGRRATAAGRNHLSIAVGSAAEACAVLDWVHLNGGAEVQEKLRRVGIMLLRLGGG